MRLPNRETAEKLREYYGEFCQWYDTEASEWERTSYKNGWRGVGKMLDMHYSVLADVCAMRPGSISQERENVLRRKLNLSPLTLPAKPCPTCGTPHTYDCGTEAVKPINSSNSKRRRKTYYRPCLPSAFKGVISNKEIENLIHIYIGEQE